MVLAACTSGPEEFPSRSAERADVAEFESEPEREPPTPERELSTESDVECDESLDSIECGLAEQLPGNVVDIPSCETNENTFADLDYLEATVVCSLSSPLRYKARFYLFSDPDGADVIRNEARESVEGDGECADGEEASKLGAGLLFWLVCYFSGSDDENFRIMFFDEVTGYVGLLSDPDPAEAYEAYMEFPTALVVD